MPLSRASTRGRYSRIVGVTPQDSIVNITSSKAEHVRQSRGYNLPKALCIREKTHKVIEYEGRCRIKSNKAMMVHKGSDVSIGTQPEEESMQRHWIIETID